MKSFFEHGELVEMAAVRVDDLDKEFIRKATQVTSFNISTKDFESLKYKSEIQHLIGTHFFPKYDLSNTIKGKPSVDKLNNEIRKLKKENKSKFLSLHNYNLKGVGPGEATLFFLLDDAHLGGGTSAGIDLVVGGKGYEVKSANLSGDGSFTGFKLGGTVNVSKMVSAALKIRDSDPKIAAAGKEKTGVNGKQIKMIMSQPKLKAEWMKNVEKPYQRAAYGYLAKEDLILMINKTPAARRGEVLFMGKPKINQISVDVVSQGTIKPRIKF